MIELINNSVNQRRFPGVTKRDMSEGLFTRSKGNSKAAASPDTLTWVTASRKRQSCSPRGLEATPRCEHLSFCSLVVQSPLQQLFTPLTHCRGAQAPSLLWFPSHVTFPFPPVYRPSYLPPGANVSTWRECCRPVMYKIGKDRLKSKLYWFHFPFSLSCSKPFSIYRLVLF